MQPVASVAVRLDERYQTAFRQCQRAAHLGVLRVRRTIERHDRVVTVVAAIQKDAHERFIVIRALCHGAQRTELREQQPACASAFEKIASSHYWTTWNCGDTPNR